MIIVESISKKNKYLEIYRNIIIKGLGRGIDRKSLKEKYGYVELHHILPKSFKMGGEKDKNNMVFLTAREHFIVHVCAIKIFDGIFLAKMNYALNQLKSSNKYQERYFNSRFYNMAKSSKKTYARLYLLRDVKYVYSEDKEQIEKYIMEGWSLKMTPEFKIGRVGNMKGKKHSSETKEKMSKSGSGKPKPWMAGVPKSKISIERSLKTRFKNKEKDPEKYKEIYDNIIKNKRETGGFDYLRENPPMRGKKHSEEHKLKQSEVAKENFQKLILNKEKYDEIQLKKSISMKSAWNNGDFNDRACNSKIMNEYNLCPKDFFILKIKPMIHLGLLPQNIVDLGLVKLSKGTLLSLIKEYGNIDDINKFKQTLKTQRQNVKNHKIKVDEIYELIKSESMFPEVK